MRKTPHALCKCISMHAFMMLKGRLVSSHAQNIKQAADFVKGSFLCCAPGRLLCFGELYIWAASVFVMHASALKRLYFLMIINNLFMPPLRNLSHSSPRAPCRKSSSCSLFVGVCGTKSFKAILMMLFEFSTAPCNLIADIKGTEPLNDFVKALNRRVHKAAPRYFPPHVFGVHYIPQQ
jgi:hypothetical protein